MIKKIVSFFLIITLILFLVNSVNTTTLTSFIVTYDLNLSNDNFTDFHYVVDYSDYNLYYSTKYFLDFLDYSVNTIPSGINLSYEVCFSIPHSLAAYNVFRYYLSLPTPVNNSYYSFDNNFTIAITDLTDSLSSCSVIINNNTYQMNLTNSSYCYYTYYFTMEEPEKEFTFQVFYNTYFTNNSLDKITFTNVLDSEEVPGFGTGSILIYFLIFIISLF